MITSVNIIRNSNLLVIQVTGVINIRSFDLILSKLNKSLHDPYLEDEICDVLLDFSGIRAIKLGGALSIVCLCSALINRKIFKFNRLSHIYLKRPPSNVLSYLSTIGFFSQMSNKGGLVDSEDLITSEDEKSLKMRNKIKLSVSKDIPLRSIVFPMVTIPEKSGTLVYKDFEEVAHEFVLKIADFFESIMRSPMFNFQDKEVHDFLLSNYELYVNIFKHSKSWGIGTIHARPNYGTSACFYDIGIGFKGSVNSKLSLDEKFTDCEAISWALKRGNSSEIDGNGEGLTVIKDFLWERKGLFEIRSGNCLFQLKDNYNEWKKTIVPWFPGAQINLFIPIRKNGR